MEPQETFIINYDINIELQPIFKTDFLNSQYDEIEINGCCYDKDSDSISPCDDEEAEFWSVYLQDVNGGRYCIADCKTYQTALQLEKLLLMVLYTNTQTKKQLRKNLIISAVNEAYNTFLSEYDSIGKKPETNLQGHLFADSNKLCRWLRATHFPQAKIVGYKIENNLSAIIGFAEGGHEFLLLDDRFIVDFWYRHIKKIYNTPIVIDTTENSSIYLAKYGDPKKWEIVDY